MALQGELVGLDGVTCSCGQELELKVCQSAAGHYLGYECSTCGPYSRETEYMGAELAVVALEAVQAGVQIATRDTEFHGLPEVYSYSLSLAGATDYESDRGCPFCGFEADATGWAQSEFSDGRPAGACVFYCDKHQAEAEAMAAWIPPGTEFFYIDKVRLSCNATDAIELGQLYGRIVVVEQGDQIEGFELPECSAKLKQLIEEFYACGWGDFLVDCINDALKEAL